MLMAAFLLQGREEADSSRYQEAYVKNHHRTDCIHTHTPPTVVKFTQHNQQAIHLPTHTAQYTQYAYTVYCVPSKPR